HYLTKENPPVFGWTPDCKWPVVYGERGRALIQFVNHGSQEDFGEMIMRGYKLGMTDDNLFFQISLSYPKVKTVDELIEMIR
ncbi:peptidase M20, partial [Erysipelothrix rhusiopathiae]|nr:peptidase M20 [Erysipelothrix rhusiopathiae]